MVFFLVCPNLFAKPHVVRPNLHPINPIIRFTHSGLGLLDLVLSAPSVEDADCAPVDPAAPPAASVPEGCCPGFAFLTPLSEGSCGRSFWNASGM